MLRNIKSLKGVWGRTFYRKFSPIKKSRRQSVTILNEEKKISKSLACCWK